MDTPFYGGFNDTIGGHIRPRRLEILMPSHDCVSSQFCRKKRPLLSQQFMAGVIDTGQK
jgi:hypothetical protein